ncbi:MAG: hypothetical protein FWD23_10460, partial [Oscillospiraceae bacterium]|nr:hypothetical protein [Oscillospiraceae bacterium]
KNRGNRRKADSEKKRIFWAKKERPLGKRKRRGKMGEKWQKKVHFMGVNSGKGCAALFPRKGIETLAVHGFHLLLRQLRNHISS